MKSMTEISQMFLFVACVYWSSCSSHKHFYVFQRYCVYSRKRIEMPVV